MTPRFICPHCHRSIDPLTLEAGASTTTRYLICPECDDLIALSVADDDIDGAFSGPSADVPVPGRTAESCVL